MLQGDTGYRKCTIVHTFSYKCVVLPGDTDYGEFTFAVNTMSYKWVL